MASPNRPALHTVRDDGGFREGKQPSDQQGREGRDPECSRRRQQDAYRLGDRPAGILREDLRSGQRGHLAAGTGTDGRSSRHG